MGARSRIVERGGVRWLWRISILKSFICQAKDFGFYPEGDGGSLKNFNLVSQFLPYSGSG